MSPQYVTPKTVSLDNMYLYRYFNFKLCFSHQMKAMCVVIIDHIVTNFVCLMDY